MIRTKYTHIPQTVKHITFVCYEPLDVYEIERRGNFERSEDVGALR
jgi:hypothetical protein